MRAGDAVVGSWRRTAAAAGALVLAFAVVATLVATGRLGDLRYADIPLVHPYPPAGYFFNPFNPGDRGDLVNSREASQVKAELIRDGQIELAASAAGDPSALPSADTGHRLTRLREVITQDAARGQVVRVESQIVSARVGKLRDPANPSATWCVEERGSSVLTYVAKETGQVLQRQSIRFDGKFWLEASNGRYLITDAQIRNEPVPSSG